MEQTVIGWFLEFNQGFETFDSAMPIITLMPANSSIEVESGLTLLKAGQRAGVEMEAGCFNCLCGTCVVEIMSGSENLEPPTAQELEVLDEWSKDPDMFRLACSARANEGSVVICTKKQP